MSNLEQKVELDINFTPQRSFYIGGVISIASLIASIGYAVHDSKQRKKAYRA